MREIVLWTVLPSIHIIKPFVELAKNRPVFCICDSRVLSFRSQQGWNDVETGKIQVESLEEKNRVENGAASFVTQFIRDHADAIHLVSGLHGCLTTNLALPRLTRLPHVRLLVIAERPNPAKGLKKWAKSLYYRRQVFRYRRKIQGYLGIGKITEDAFHSFGVPRKKLFPYMYTSCYAENSPWLQTAGGEETPHSGGETLPVKLVYVGRDIPCKGLDLLLEAMTHFSPRQFQLDLIGLSDDSWVHTALDEKGLSDRVRSLGRFPNEQILERLAPYDLLILPSRYDGWGMVVSEAILSGVAVLVSDRCGSRDLVESFQAGQVIAGGSAAAIVQALENVARNSKIVQHWKENSRKHSRLLLPAVVAKYMESLFEFLHFDENNGNDFKNSNQNVGNLDDVNQGGQEPGGSMNFNEPGLDGQKISDSQHFDRLNHSNRFDRFDRLNNRPKAPWLMAREDIS